jgi:Hsp70 protein
VLRSSSEGFEPVGLPDGIDPLGGEDFDQHLLDHLAAGPAGKHPDWPKLAEPSDVGWRIHKATLRHNVRAAKETLSRSMAAPVLVPGLNMMIQLTRAEFNELIRPDIQEAVEVMVRAIAAAGQAPQTLAGVYLARGSSRIPLVAELLWHRLGLRPITRDDPKSVVALGAVAWLVQQPLASPSSLAAAAGTRMTTGLSSVPPSQSRPVSPPVGDSLRQPAAPSGTEPPAQEARSPPAPAEPVSPSVSRPRPHRVLVLLRCPRGLRIGKMRRQVDRGWTAGRHRPHQRPHLFRSGHADGPWG